MTNGNMSNNRFLDGRVAVVTGGGRGIGLAIGLALAGAGARIAVLERDAAPMNAAVDAVRALGVDAIGFIADVREQQQVIAAVDGIRERFGAAHILVNSAGTAIRKNIVDFTLDEFRTVIDSNLTGTFLMSKHLLPLMRGHGYGRIINLSSVMGHVSSTGRGVYSASKHAVLGLTKALAMELVDDAITCVAISPGFIATDLTAVLRSDPDKSAALLAQTPMKRYGTAAEVASLALYICSDGAAFMTGNDVLMDGGWCAQ